MHRLSKWKFPTISFIAASIVWLNLAFIHSTIIGACASIAYIVTNGYILGTLFFKGEKVILKTALGALVLLALLGLISSPLALFYRLGPIEVATVLFAISAVNFLGANTRA